MRSSNPYVSNLNERRHWRVTAAGRDAMSDFLVPPQLFETVYRQALREHHDAALVVVAKDFRIKVCDGIDP